MNKERRKKINEVIDTLSEAQSVIRDVSEEEQEAFDNLPEGIQNSERGVRMSEYIETLAEQDGALDDIISYLTEIAEG